MAVVRGGWDTCIRETSSQDSRSPRAWVPPRCRHRRPLPLRRRWPRPFCRWRRHVRVVGAEGSCERTEGRRFGLGLGVGGGEGEGGSEREGGVGVGVGVWGEGEGGGEREVS